MNRAESLGILPRGRLLHLGNRKGSDENGQAAVTYSPLST